MKSNYTQQLNQIHKNKKISKNENLKKKNFFLRNRKKFKLHIKKY